MRAKKAIEKIIRTKLNLTVDPPLRHQLLASALREQAQSQETESTDNLSTVRGIIVRRPMVKLGVAAMAMVVMVVAIVGIVRVGRTPPETATAPESSTTLSVHEEIFAVREMAAAGDVKGLTTILSEGHFESKLVAANFLAKMVSMPALDSVTMHAVGQLRAERREDKLRVYSTGHTDWLELTDGTLVVYTGAAEQQAAMVRVTHDREGNQQDWEERQLESSGLRQERANIEEQLTGTTDVPSDANQFRERMEQYNEMLDLIDGAIYVSVANGGLHLEDRVYHREAYLFPSDRGVRAEWHGDVLDANGVTLLHGLAPVRTDGPAPSSNDWRSRFDQVYSLADGEVLRWIRPPFIPERRNYTQTLHYYSGTDNPPPPLFLSFHWDGTLHNWTLAMSECSVGSVLQALGLKRYEWAGPNELLQLRLGGDWIIRTDTPFEDTLSAVRQGKNPIVPTDAFVEKRLSALQQILERQLGREIRFALRTVEREVLVVRGHYEQRALEGHAATEPIYLFAGTTPDDLRLRTAESLVKMLDRLAERYNRPIVLEAPGLDNVSVEYQTCLSYETFLLGELDPEDPFPMYGVEDFDSVLANLTKQTSLEFAREIRPFDTWFVSEIDAPNVADPGQQP